MGKQAKRYLQLALPLVIVIALIIGIIKYANGAEVLNALRSFNYWYAAPMLLASTLYLLVIAWRFVVLLRPLADVRWQLPFKSFIAGQPGLLIPGGLALRAGLLNQAGVDLGKGSVPVVLSSVLDQVAFFLVSLVAALWLPEVRTPVLILLGVLSLLAIALLFDQTRQWFQRSADWAARKLHIEDQWQQFQTDFPKTMTWPVIGTTLGLTALSLGLTVLVLDLNVRAFGETVSYHALLLAFVLPTMLGRLSPAPGGIGVTEASMVGVLVSVAALSRHSATAVVIIFRLATLLFQASLGAAVYFLIWRGKKEKLRANATS